MSTKIASVHGREILDSRGFPTVEVELALEGAPPARAAVPSGASTGEGEALELRDGDKSKFLGKGVLKAVGHVNGEIARAVIGKSFDTQAQFDEALLQADGTPNKSKLGANAILGASLAFARARAAQAGVPLYQSIARDFANERHGPLFADARPVPLFADARPMPLNGAGSGGVTLPVPLMNIVNGGKHADNGLAIQEFMIAPAGFARFSDALRAGVEVFHHLKKILHDRGLSTGVGDEGGFAPVFKTHEEVIQTILVAVQAAGYAAGKDIFLALDCAASEYSKKTDAGVIYDFEGKKLTSTEMSAIYAAWAKKYPIVSIEDGLSEHDWSGWTALTAQMGAHCQLVGDDLFVTNETYLKEGIAKKAGNAILIKVNQIGTLTETLTTMKLARSANMNSISSHRSGETEDTFIADLAVGTDCGQIKTGSASRTDRLAKYNQLLRIEEQLGTRAKFAGVSVFRNFSR